MSGPSTAPFGALGSLPSDCGDRFKKALGLSGTQLSTDGSSDH